MPLVKDGETFNTCQQRWIYFESDSEEIRKHFEVLKDSDVKRGDKKHVFKLLCHKFTVEDATRIAYDPSATMDSITRHCGAQFEDLRKNTHGAARKMLNQVGKVGFVKWVEHMVVTVVTGISHTPNDWAAELRTVADVAATKALQALDKLGNKKLARLNSFGLYSFCMKLIWPK